MQRPFAGLVALHITSSEAMRNRSAHRYRCGAVGKGTEPAAFVKEVDNNVHYLDGTGVRQGSCHIVTAAQSSADLPSIPHDVPGSRLA
jgi:hypothetical protein